MNTEITDIRVAGWILFDGDCRWCAAAARRWAKPLGRRGFAVLPLQTAWVARRLRLRPGEPPPEMCLLTADGRRYGGADALLRLARDIAWARPLWLLSFLPGVRPLLRAAYGAVARRRPCLDERCGVSRKTPAKPDDPRIRRGPRPARIRRVFFELP